MTAVADLTGELVAMPSPSGDEGSVLERCAAVLDEAGLAVSRDRLGNVLATAGVGRPRILFDGHADTVAPNRGWSRDPYRSEQVNGDLFGLGAVDMKGPIAALMLGVGDAVERNAVQGSVAISISTLEEVLEGATLASAVEAFEPDWVVIAEPSGLRLMTAQRGRAEITVMIEGKAAHAAFPEQGQNALLGATEFLAALKHREEPNDPELGPGILVPTEAFTDPLPGISVVPSACRIRLDRRTLPGETEGDVLGELEPALDAARRTGTRAQAVLTQGPVETYTGLKLDERRFLPAWRTPTEAPLSTAAEEALSEALGEVHRSHYAFCTNGSLTAGRLGLPTIGFGPGDPEQAHQADEHIAIAELEHGRRGFAALAGMTNREGQWKNS
jgi:putative selenium metabolism hydrolase